MVTLHTSELHGNLQLIPREPGLPQEPWTLWLQWVTNFCLPMCFFSIHWITCADIQSFLLVFNAINFKHLMFSWTVDTFSWKCINLSFNDQLKWRQSYEDPLISFWKEGTLVFFTILSLSFWHFQFNYVFWNRGAWNYPQNYPLIHPG